MSKAELKTSNSALSANVLCSPGKCLVGVAASKKDATTPPAPTPAQHAASRTETEYASV
jgi:hypothetical protein